MMKLLSILPLYTVSCLQAQQTPLAHEVKRQEQRQILTESLAAGVLLPSTINVRDNVNVEAVMLPKAVTKRVFGKEVANNYAVIEVNISNRSKDAALILQSVLIDISGWSLAGHFDKGRETPTPTYQSHSSTKEISSVEYRIVRGQMLDAQPFSSRNLTMRILQVMGSIGTAYAFPFSKDVVAGIGAWNGAVVPGADVLWPDGMIGQINRISDYGFRNNKIVPQQSADIVIAFFPIDRFLTPSLRSAFLEYPALFFNPVLMAIDPKTQILLAPVIANVFGAQAHRALRGLLNVIADQDDVAIKTYESNIAEDQKIVRFKERELVDLRLDRENLQERYRGSGYNYNNYENALETLKQSIANKEQEIDHKREQIREQEWLLNEETRPLRMNRVYRLLESVSLNNVHIAVSGIMTVDELTIPATIESTCFDKPTPDLWASAGDKKCWVAGRFLSGGVPKIGDADTLGISAITVDKDGSTGELLKFSFNLKKALDSPVKFDIVVEKTEKNDKTVDSMKYLVSSSFLLSAPANISLTPKNATGKITVTGTGFLSGPNNAFVVSLRQSPGKDFKVPASPDDKGTSFVLDTASFDPAIAPGCYNVVVQVGTLVPAVSTDQLRVDPNPTIKSVHWDGKAATFTVTGNQFVNTIGCGGSNVSFELLDASGAPVQTVSLQATDTETSATLPKPASATQIRVKGSAIAPLKIAAGAQ